MADPRDMNLKGELDAAMGRAPLDHTYDHTDGSLTPNPGQPTLGDKAKNAAVQPPKQKQPVHITPQGGKTYDQIVDEMSK